MDAAAIIARFYHREPDLKQLLEKHSRQVWSKAEAIAAAADISLDMEIVKTGAMLHDIGIIRCYAPGILCRGEAPYICHGTIGAQMLRELGGGFEPFARICERHTGSGLTAAEIRRQQLPLPENDFLPESNEEKLICLADKFFSKSGNMEEKPFPAVRASMAKFGTASLARFDGLCRCFGIVVN